MFFYFTLLNEYTFLKIAYFQLEYVFTKSYILSLHFFSFNSYQSKSVTLQISGTQNYLIVAI